MLKYRTNDFIRCEEPFLESQNWYEHHYGIGKGSEIILKGYHYGGFTEAAYTDIYIDVRGHKFAKRLERTCMSNSQEMIMIEAGVCLNAILEKMDKIKAIKNYTDIVINEYNHIAKSLVEILKNVDKDIYKPVAEIVGETFYNDAMLDTKKYIDNRNYIFDSIGCAMVKKIDEKEREAFKEKPEEKQKKGLKKWFSKNEKEQDPLF